MKQITGILGTLTTAIIVLFGCSKPNQSYQTNTSYAIDSILQLAVDSMDKNPQFSIELLNDFEEQITDSVDIGYLKLTLANIYSILSDVENAKELAETVIDFHVRNPKGEASQKAKMIGYTILGNYYAVRHDNDSALYYHNKCAENLDGLSNPQWKFNSAINLSDLYLKAGDIVSGIAHLNDALSIADTMAYAETLRFSAYYGLVNSYIRIGDYNTAWHYLQRAESCYDALSLFDKFLYHGAQMLYYEEIKEFDNALKASLKQQQVLEDNDYHRLFCDLNIGYYYYELNHLDSAGYHLDLAYNFFEQNGFDHFLLHIETIRGMIALKRNNPEVAEKWLLLRQIPKDLHDTKTISTRNKALQKLYLLQGNYRRAYDMVLENHRFDDSLTSERVMNRIAEIGLRYKQDSTILRKDLFIDQQNTRISFLQSIRKLWIVIGCISFALALLTYYNLLRKRKTNAILEAKNKVIEHQNKELHLQNIEITEQKEEIEAQRDEIEAQRDEIEAQRDFVIEQKNQIEVMHKHLTDSIGYAKLIQRAALSDIQVIEDIFPSYFLIFKPRDIVSGDFYWFASQGDYAYIAIADCTGHGVPGAFMSMLGISFLNEYFARTTIESPAIVLDQLRSYIISSLQQKGRAGEQQDGMDIAFVVLNRKTLQIVYAAANSPMFLLSKDSREVQKVKADSMPAAIYVKMSPFTDHTIQLSRGDRFYLLSDGYTDQFGGESGKKFMASKFRQLLLSISMYDMKEQKQHLEQELDNWMHPSNGVIHPQTDDITVFGLQV